METFIPAPSIRGICEIRGQNNRRFQVHGFRRWAGLGRWSSSCQGDHLAGAPRTEPKSRLICAIGDRWITRLLPSGSTDHIHFAGIVFQSDATWFQARPPDLQRLRPPLHAQDGNGSIDRVESRSEVDFPRWTEAIAIDQPKPDPDAGGVAGGTLKPDPESGSGTDIAPERGGGGGLGDREVDPAIPVKIRNGRRTSFAMDLHPGIVVGKESALAIAQQPQAAPGIIPLLHWMTG